MAHAMTMAKDMRECIDICDECRTICLEAVTYCLEKGGQHAAPDHIKLLLDCANICDTSAQFMARDSMFHATTCATCAEICERCAESCESIGDDEMMKACAEVCRRCASSCQGMAAMGKAA